MTHKVVLITGAAHRIGATTARTLHACGFNIVLHFRSSKDAAERLQQELQQSRADSVSLLQADLHDLKQITQLAEQAQAIWGRLDVLINNASSFYATEIGQVGENEWDDLVGSNMKAPFFLSQACAASLRQQHGAIVNIVDIHAERPLKGFSVYSMAKAGLAMMTKALACELGPEIRVNGIAPGAILWPDQLDDAGKEKIVARTFLKRKGEPEDIANTIRFLVTEANYMTGQILAVDGGRSLNS